MEHEFNRVISLTLRAQRDKVISYLLSKESLFAQAVTGKATLYQGLAKAGTDWEATLDELGITFDPWLDDITDILTRAAQSGAGAGLDRLSDYLDDLQDRAFSAMVNQVNTAAADWAREHAARLVTEISDTTRDMLREQISDAIERGLSVKELASEIRDCSAFAPERAELIAVTELAEADVRGNKIAYADSGVVVGLRWVAEGGYADDAICDACAMNSGAVVPIGPDGMAAEPYPSGARGVPAHPRCRCDEIPVLAGEDDGDEDEDKDGDA